MKKEIKKGVSQEEVDLIEKGKFYFLNAKYNAAITEFEKVLKINSKSANAYFNIGIIKEAKNDTDGAREMYEKTLEINPGHKLAKKHLDKIIGI